MVTVFWWTWTEKANGGLCLCPSQFVQSREAVTWSATTNHHSTNSVVVASASASRAVVREPIQLPFTFKSIGIFAENIIINPHSANRSGKLRLRNPTSKPGEWATQLASRPATTTAAGKADNRNTPPPQGSFCTAL